MFDTHSIKHLFNTVYFHEKTKLCLANQQRNSKAPKNLRVRTHAQT